MKHIIRTFFCLVGLFATVAAVVCVIGTFTMPRIKGLKNEDADDDDDFDDFEDDDMFDS